MTFIMAYLFVQYLLSEHKYFRSVPYIYANINAYMCGAERNYMCWSK